MVVVVLMKCTLQSTFEIDIEEIFVEDNGLFGIILLYHYVHY